MVKYTKKELDKRKTILQSQIKFTCFLNLDMINLLIYLFDHKNQNDDNPKIIKYIQDERKVKGLNSSNITIEHKVYGEYSDSSTLHLGIRKNNRDILHLSIHLCVKNLEPKHTGVIHIYKNIYRILNPLLQKKILYALISIEQPPNKPNSLKFSISDGYTTPGVNNAKLYDLEIQKEMDIIITVLNKLFDEDNSEYYIGNKNKLIPIHDKTNIVLKTINQYSEHAVRKNKGVQVFPLSINSPTFEIEPKKLTKKIRKRTTRKIKK